jgi:hypothetical protein
MKRDACCVLRAPNHETRNTQHETRFLASLLFTAKA